MNNMFACENLMNSTLAQSMQTHNLIDELFNQASNMEAQSKEDDNCMLQM